MHRFWLRRYLVNRVLLSELSRARWWSDCLAWINFLLFFGLNSYLIFYLLNFFMYLRLIYLQIVPHLLRLGSSVSDNLSNSTVLGCFCFLEWLPVVRFVYAPVWTDRLCSRIERADVLGAPFIIIEGIIFTSLLCWASGILSLVYSSFLVYSLILAEHILR